MLKQPAKLQGLLRKIILARIKLSFDLNNKGADRTARMRILVCSFVARMHKIRFSCDDPHMPAHNIVVQGYPMFFVF